MRGDLREALHAVLWAKSHIPVMQERFVTWQRRNPYHLVMEPDPDHADWEFLTAYLRTPLDPLVIGDAGAIINSTRSALDIMMSALLTANGKKPNSRAHFPIRKAPADFLTAVDMLEHKKWIVPAEATAIKRTKAYLGGNHFLYPLHQLDILRKHERLLSVQPSVGESQLTLINGASYIHRIVMDDKTILYRIPSGAHFSPTQGNTLLSAEIFFKESNLFKTHQPATGVLRNFVECVQGTIEGFPGSN